jgi:hypothetical protein
MGIGIPHQDPSQPFDPYSFINFSKFPYICFGLISEHLQGVKYYTYEYNTSICSFNCICSVDHLCLLM